MNARLIVGCLLFFAVLFAACDEEDCEDLISGEYDEELNELRQQCDCDFTIQCDPELDEGDQEGRHGVTIRGPDGRPLITLPEDVDEEVLKHELVHAVDNCRNFSRQQAGTEIVGRLLIVKYPFIRDLPPRCLDLVISYFELVTAEFIAYRKFMAGLDEELPDNMEDRFPESDADDARIFQGFLTGQDFMMRLEEADRDKLREILTRIHLVPGEVRGSDEDYQDLKRVLIEIAERWEEEAEDCCELIDERIDF